MWWNIGLGHLVTTLREKRARRRRNSQQAILCRRLQFESLEERRVLTTTLFLDFGLGIGMGNVLSSTVADVRDIDGVGLNGFGTGPDLHTAVYPMSESSSLDFRPLNYDFNGDATIDNSDLIALAAAVMPLVERLVEPFDIDVVMASASSLADIVASLHDNDSPTNAKQNDVYSLILDVRSDFYGGGSVGTNQGLYGIAAEDDLFDQSGNNQDEVTLTFADTVFSRLIFPGGETPGTQAFNDKLVHRLADTITHEAFHTFGLTHTGSLNFLFQPLIAGDVVRADPLDESPKEAPTIVTRFPLPRESGVSEPTNYHKIASDPLIGLRDDDSDGVPNLAYVTGTGAFDKITLERDATNPDLVHVTVAAYYDADYTVLIASTTYDIDLALDTEGEILIDSSRSGDLIEIDASIAASIRIRGMLGDDQVVLKGNGASALRSFTFDGEGDNDTLTLDFQNGDPLPLAGYDFNFIGGLGTDTASVIEAGGTPQTAYFVNTLADVADMVVGDGRADSSAADDDQTTLRAAVQEANAASASTRTYIFLPTGTHTLSVSGGGGDAEGDLDITGDVIIIGAGAGATVITAPAADRHFDVDASGALRIERLTLTGGSTPGQMGSAIYVRPRPVVTSDALILNEAAIVNNGTALAGGAIFVGVGAKALIEKSVIVNDSAYYGGGGIAADASAAGFAEVTLSESIVANNSTTMGDPDLASATSGGNVGRFISLGYNLIGQIGNANFTPLASDYESPTGVVDYVVTSVRDTFDHVNNGETLRSLREAIYLANVNDGVAEEIWAPGWNFLLTRKSSAPGANDHDISYGDLEISDTLTIRGAGQRFIQVTQTTLEYQDFDAVFDLLGDFTGNGAVSDDGAVAGDDLLTWQTQNGLSGGDFSADADDDGDVDADDLAIWSAGYGNSLTLHNFFY